MPGCCPQVVCTKDLKSFSWSEEGMWKPLLCVVGQQPPQGLPPWYPHSASDLTGPVIRHSSVSYLCCLPWHTYIHPNQIDFLKHHFAHVTTLLKTNLQGKAPFQPSSLPPLNKPHRVHATPAQMPSLCPAALNSFYAVLTFWNMHFLLLSPHLHYYLFDSLWNMGIKTLFLKSWQSLT